MQYTGEENECMHGNRQADVHSHVGLGIPLHVRLCITDNNYACCILPLKWQVGQNNESLRLVFRPNFAIVNSGVYIKGVC